MATIANVNGKWMVSGFKDESQEGDTIKTGFDNIIFEVFDTQNEATKYINEIEK